VKKYFLPFFIVIMLMAILLILFMKQEKTPELTNREFIRQAVVKELARLSETAKSMRMDFVHSGLDNPKTDNILQKMYSKLENTHASLTIDKTGKILRYFPAEAKNTINKVQEISLQNILQAQDPFFSKAVLIDTGQTAALLGYPIWDEDNNFSGMMAAIVSVNSLWSEYKQQLDESDNFWIIQQDGLLLYASNPKHIGKSIYKSQLPFSGEHFAEINAALQKFQQGEVELEQKDKQYIVYWNTLNFKGRIWKFLELTEK
jgi:hypothetical protein